MSSGGIGTLSDKLGKIPFALSALMVIVGIVCVDYWVWFRSITALWMLALCLGGLSWWRPKHWGMALLFCVLAGGLHYFKSERQKFVSQGVGQLIRERVVLVSDIVPTEAGAWAFAEVKTGEYSGARLKLSIEGSDLDLLRGDLLTVYGSLIGISELRNPAGFEQKQWLRREGVSARLWAKEWRVEGAVWWRPVVQRLQELRGYVDASITLGLSEDEALLVRAMFLGEKPKEDHPIIEDFRNSGTLHVFAVSGLHVMMVGGIVFWCARVFRLPLFVRILCVIVIMFLYAGITGWNAPAVRAALMGSVLMYGVLLRRKVVVLNSMAVCVVLVCIVDGNAPFHPGFQLSYGVILALVLCYPWWCRRLAFLYSVEEFLPRQLYTSKQVFHTH